MTSHDKPEAGRRAASNDTRAGTRIDAIESGPDDVSVRAAYRHAADRVDGPPDARVRATVLAAARRAVATPRHGPPPFAARRWPLSLAAVLVVSVLTGLVVVRVADEAPDRLARPARVESVTSPVPRSTERTDRTSPVSDAASMPASADASGPASASATRAARGDASGIAGAPQSPKTKPALSTRASASASPAGAHDRPEDEHGPSAASPSVAPPRAPLPAGTASSGEQEVAPEAGLPHAVPSAPTPREAPDAAASTARTLPSIAAAAPFPASPAGPSMAWPEDASRTDGARSDRPAMGGSLTLASRGASEKAQGADGGDERTRDASHDAANGPADDVEPATPDAWIERIVRLRAAGRRAAADRALAALRARYPDVVVPAAALAPSGTR